MKIYAIRHGQTKLNVQGLINGQIGDELTTEGIEQAKNAANSVPSSVKRIYASPLHRAKQTAEYINKELKLPISFHDELMEVNFGVLQGTPYLKEYQKRHAMVDYDWKPSGENVDEVRARTLKILSQIRNENQDGEALIVAHGGTIRMLHYLESGDRPDDIGNASIHSFDVDQILS